MFTILHLSYYSADLISRINARIAAAKSDIDQVFYVRNIGIHGNSCVKKTCLDAVNAGYNVTLNLKCTAARNEKIFEKTLGELTDAGVVVINC